MKIDTTIKLILSEKMASESELENLKSILNKNIIVDRVSEGKFLFGNGLILHYIFRYQIAFAYTGFHSNFEPNFRHFDKSVFSMIHQKSDPTKILYHIFINYF